MNDTVYKYFEQYSKEYTSKNITNEQCFDICLELYEKQAGKCAISNVEFDFQPSDKTFNQSYPYLKSNYSKPWLPIYELVLWPFRKYNHPFKTVLYGAHNQRIIVDDEYDEDDLELEF